MEKSDIHDGQKVPDSTRAIDDLYQKIASDGRIDGNDSQSLLELEKLRFSTGDRLEGLKRDFFDVLERWVTVNTTQDHRSLLSMLYILYPNGLNNIPVNQRFHSLAHSSLSTWYSFVLNASDHQAMVYQNDIIVGSIDLTTWESTIGKSGSRFVKRVVTPAGGIAAWVAMSAAIGLTGIWGSGIEVPLTLGAAAGGSFMSYKMATHHVWPSDVFDNPKNNNQISPK